MIPQFIKDFNIGELNEIFSNFNLPLIKTIKCDFPIIVPIDPVGQNRVKAIAMIEAAKIIMEHYVIKKCN